MHPHVSRNTALDAVRGIAILMVLVWHIAGPWASTHSEILRIAVSTTWSGVDLFFVLSGYLIGGILLRNRSAGGDYRCFYMRRMLRILPLYIVFLLGYVATQGYSWEELSFVSFTQNIMWSMKSTFGPEIIAPTWSLAVEEQFYMILPFLIRTCPKERIKLVLLTAIIAAPFLRLIAISLGLAHGAYMFLPCRVDSLFLGVLIAHTTQQMKGDSRIVVVRTYVAWATAFLGLGFAGFTALGLDALDPLMATIGYSVIDLFYAGVVFLVVTKQSNDSALLRPLAWCGLGAYSMYLFHMPIWVLVFHPMGHGLGPPIGALAAIFAVAVVCWRLIEAPAIAFGHRSFVYRHDGAAGLAAHGTTVNR
jgi:peptidoglycan/LPS O-acetylase OafA/YrhL